MSEFKKRAVEVSFDLSKQFISLAFAGIAFAVGLSAGNDRVGASLLFWVVIGLFTASSLLGFLYLMRGTAALSSDKEFDIYGILSRIWAILQILFVFGGVVLLLILHLKSNNKVNSISPSTIEVTVDQKRIQYTVPVGKDIKIMLANDGTLDFQTLPATSRNPTNN